MAKGDVFFGLHKNEVCEIEQEDGSRQRAIYVAVSNEKGLDVNVQDQSSELLSLYLGKVLDTITVLNNTTKDDMEIDIETTGTTPLVGDYICLQEDSKISQEEIVTVTSLGGNQYRIGLNMPLDSSFTTASGCKLLDIDMAKDGSVTEIPFEVGPKVGIKWDITRMITSMVLDSAGDDGLFGNISALDNGVYYRKEDSDESNNIFNAKENSDYALEGYDVEYPVRSGGGGSHGFRSRITFAGQSKQGVVIRLNGDTGDTFKVVVRDDLTDIITFRTKIQGHVVED